MMGFSLLAPLFLAGLAAIAVPLAVHLRNRDRREVVEFPSLMFLRRIPYRSVRRQRLRHPLLFALRSLVIVLLVAAFARPFLEEAGLLAGGGRETREVVILLDRSYSMDYGDRWSRARTAARRAIDGLDAGDRATLVLFSDAAVATDATTDPAELTAALDGATPGAGITRFAPAVRLAAARLADTDRSRREVVLISDLQRGAWSGGEEGRLPAGTAVSIVDLSESATPNVAMTGVEVRRAQEDGRATATVTAYLANHGDGAIDALPVTLELNGREVESRPARLTGGGSGPVTFAAVPLPNGTTRGRVRVKADALPTDDAFHFTLPPADPLRVLIIEAANGSASSLYLRRALAVAERPALELETRTLDRVTPGDLAGRSVVVLNDAGAPRAALARALGGFVRQGGGLILLAGERTAAGQLPAELSALLPTSFAASADRMRGGGGRLASIDRSHPVFAAFTAPRSGDFSAARFYRYRPLAAGDSASASTTILARLDDGSAMLAERRVGAGRVLLWGSTLDTYWNDLALQPVYLPFVHALATYAAGHVEERPWRLVGETIAPRDLADAAWTAATPSGRAMPVERGAALRLEEPGFYELRRAAAGREAAQVVAANVDRAESDLTAWDAAELRASLVADGAVAAAVARAEAPTAEEREQRQALWRYLLLAALLVLAVESVVSWRVIRSSRETVP